MKKLSFPNVLFCTLNSLLPQGPSKRGPDFKLTGLTKKCGIPGKTDPFESDCFHVRFGVICDVQPG